MKYAQFDKYARYLKGAALLIALLTYWRFRELDLSAVYAYVAQSDVIRSVLFQSVSATRSVVWDFFGLIDRIVTPRSIMLLRIAGLSMIVLDLYLVSRVLDHILGQKFWGFLGMFLAALSPFAVVSAVCGGPGGVAAALTLLFIMALYRNQYIYAGLLSGVCFAANLPALVMFLITLLDLLQNLTDRKKMLSKLLTTTAVFAGVVVAVYAYSLFSGNVKVFSIPFGEHDMKWSLAAAVPFFAANVLNIAGIVYMVMKKRYDVYRTHFHTLMLWIASCALCVAQPSTSNLLVALIVSTILSMFFLQGFNSLWSFRLLSADTFVFLFVVLFLFGDLYTNNTFLKNVALRDSQEENQTVGEVLSTIAGQGNKTNLVSNFAPAELSVKLGRQVYEVGRGVLPVGGLQDPSAPVIYVVKRQSSVDSVMAGCRTLLTTSLNEGDKTYSVQVVRCSENE